MNSLQHENTRSEFAKVGLGYGDTAKLASALEEISRLLSAYAAAILSSAS
jgi:hypothetical protein